MSENQSLMPIGDPPPMVPAPLEVFKAPITPAQAKIDAVANLTMKAYERASTLQLTPEEIAGLKADFPDEAFKPGAGGKEHLIYIEHAFLRDRLTEVLGLGQWAIVPRNRWAEDFTTAKGTEASRVYVEAMLCIRGCFVAESVGEMEYYKNNASQNYGDAVEGAKTAALRRCAKELGVGLQAWKKDFCDGWWARQRGGQKPNVPQNVPQPKPHTAGTAKPPGSEPVGAPAEPNEAQRQKWIGMLKELGPTALAWLYEKEWLLGPSGQFSGDSIEALSATRVPRTKREADAILAEIRARMPAEPQKPAGAPSAGPSDLDLENAPEGEQEPEQGNPDGVETITGKLDFVKEKSGRSGKGPWTSYGLKVGDEWFNTFSRPLGECAKKDKGHTVRICFKRGDRGNDLVSIERARKE